MKRFLIGLTAILSVVIMSGCSLPGTSSSAPAPNRTCVDKLIKSFETNRSQNLWECASKNLQATWYNSNSQVLDPTTGKSEAWNSDADITLWLQSLTQYFSSIDVQQFSGNPLTVTDSNGNIVGYNYLITVWGQFQDGSYSTSPASFIVTINLQGQIVSLA